ncbi:hypothetical protein SFUMM280S_04063 [Streptomyces fumanus]
MTLHIDADVKFDSKVLTDVAEARRTGFSEAMFKQRGGRWIAVVEGHAERTEPGPDEDKNPSVKIRVTSVEVAADEITGGRLRNLQREMYEPHVPTPSADPLSGRGAEPGRHGTSPATGTPDEPLCTVCGDPLTGYRLHRGYTTHLACDPETGSHPARPTHPTNTDRPNDERHSA